MRLSRIARKPVEVDLTTTLPSGQPAEPEAALFALCDHGGPTAETVWVPGTFTPAAGTAGQPDYVPAFFTITVCGPDAEDKAGPVLLMTKARMELWALPTNGDTVAADFIDTIELP